MHTIRVANKCIHAFLMNYCNYNLRYNILFKSMHKKRGREEVFGQNDRTRIKIKNHTHVGTHITQLQA